MKGKWKQLKGSVKERWGKLTDDDLDVINGQAEQLVGTIQERYGIAREAAQKQVDEWNSAASKDKDNDTHQRREARDTDASLDSTHDDNQQRRAS
jgi:uncharacterized protein YjbJ (UPF0337 family)